jgi:tripartite-type tricarboxylate transporter receptor subunit TctC
VVGFPAGGPVDFVARTLAEPLGKALGAQVIVDNKPGANGAIAAEAVAHAAADGSTLWLTSVGAIAVNPVLYEKLAYDVGRDFMPVSLVVNNDELLVIKGDNPAGNVADWLAAAKKQGRTITIASSGIGSIPHLAGEQFALATKANLLHVPYKGAAPAITDVIGGQVDGFFGDIPGLVAHLKAGKLKAIGLAAAKRSPVLPDVPTLAEQGIPGVDSNNWYALYVPAKTPPERIAALNQALRTVLASADVSTRLLGSGTEPAPSSPQAMADLARADTEKWGTLIRANKIKPE